jgi:hypothetical protein
LRLGCSQEEESGEQGNYDLHSANLAPGPRAVCPNV